MVSSEHQNYPEYGGENSINPFLAVRKPRIRLGDIPRTQQEWVVAARTLALKPLVLI